MAGSATIIKNKREGSYREIIWKWTSNGSGAVNGVGKIHVPQGTIVGMWSDPGSGVSDNWDVTLPGTVILPNGETTSVTDMLNGNGADLSNSTNGEIVNLDVTLFVPNNTEIGLSITNAGSEVSGYFMLFIWEEQMP